MMGSTEPYRKQTKPYKLPQKIAFLAVALASALVVLVLSSPNCWEKWGAAKVTLDGRPVSASTSVYRSRDGDVMLYLMEGTYPEIYIIKTKSSKVGILPSNTGFLLLPGCAYSKHGPPLAVPLDGTEAKMDNFNAELSIQSECFEFTSLQGRRIHITW